jgi:TAT (twin-arginine translocation) pathway signal sequence
MLRRDFIKTSGAVVAGTALPGMAFGAEPVAAGRVILPMNRRWLGRRR